MDPLVWLCEIYLRQQDHVGVTSRGNWPFDVPWSKEALMKCSSAGLGPRLRHFARR